MASFSSGSYSSSGYAPQEEPRRPRISSAASRYDFEKKMEQEREERINDIMRRIRLGLDLDADEVEELGVEVPEEYELYFGRYRLKYNKIDSISAMENLGWTPTNVSTQAGTAGSYVYGTGPKGAITPKDFPGLMEAVRATKPSISSKQAEETIGLAQQRLTESGARLGLSAPSSKAQEAAAEQKRLQDANKAKRSADKAKADADEANRAVEAQRETLSKLYKQLDREKDPVAAGRIYRQIKQIEDGAEILKYRADNAAARKTKAESDALDKASRAAAKTKESEEQSATISELNKWIQFESHKHDPRVASELLGLMKSKTQLALGADALIKGAKAKFEGAKREREEKLEDVRERAKITDEFIRARQSDAREYAEQVASAKTQQERNDGLSKMQANIDQTIATLEAAGATLDKDGKVVDYPTEYAPGVNAETISKTSIFLQGLIAEKRSLEAQYVESPAGGSGLMTRDEFIAAFTEDYGVAPSDAQIAAARGKYWE